MKRHRPAVPDRIALEAALHHGQIICGCGECGQPIRPGEMHREHDPALELRDYDPATRQYTPPANDPTYIKLWRGVCHDKKTHGPGGERRVTTKGSDNHSAKRLKNLGEKHAQHLAAMAAKAGQIQDQEGGEHMQKRDKKLLKKAVNQAAKKRPMAQKKPSAKPAK